MASMSFGAREVREMSGRAYLVARRNSWKIALVLAPLCGAGLVADESASLEWEKKAAVRCAEAETLLRAGKAKAAFDLLAPMLKDEHFNRSASLNRILYLHGFASFQLKDYHTAGRSLGRLAPFNDPALGGHARYVLGRLHHLEDERAEAAAQYEAVIAEYDAAQKSATAPLQEAEKLQAEEKARLEAIANAPVPEHVARASFYLGLLHYEGGRFIEAQARFADFAARNPKSPFVAEAQFFQGCCAVHLRQFPEAIESLGTLAEREPSVAGPALHWLGKAFAASADPDDEDNYQPTLQRAHETLRRAVDASKKDRCGEVLLDLADACQMAGKPDEAAKIYGRILAQRLLTTRDEEVLQRQVTALNLSGAFDESEKLATKFEQGFPHSLLLPEVLFRRGSNAFLSGGKNVRNADSLDRAARCFRFVADKYPEFAHANRARYFLAWTHYEKVEFDKAREVLETIPQAERTADLADVTFLLADCLLRLAPTKADDALAAGKLQEQIGTAATLLTDFVADQPDSPLAFEALLRLGLCHQRLASVLSNPEERNKVLATARSSYERALVEYPRNELGPVAALARACCLNKSGDANEAIKRLQAFVNGALKNEPAAPLAMLHLAELIGAQENKAPEAARILTQCRRRHEQALRRDPIRAGWVPLIQYRHGLALMDAGNYGDSRAVLSELRRNYPLRPEAAEAALCWGQALRDGGGQTIEKANQTSGTPNLSPAERDRAVKETEKGQRMIRDALHFFEEQGEKCKGQAQGGDIRARFLYEAIWMYRGLANDEVAAARGKLQEERQAQRREELTKLTPEGEQPPDIPPPEVPSDQVPLQSAETKTRALYQTLIGEFSDLPLALAARLELGEMYAERGEHEAAV
jgi:TolA-binding protein